MRQQIKARNLRAQGKSVGKIAQLLKVSKSSVSNWVRDVELRAAQRIILRNKAVAGAKKGRAKIEEMWHQYRTTHPQPLPDIALQNNLRQIHTFFSVWSSSMAYVLGFFAADGCMYHSRNGGYSTGGFYIAFYSTDLKLLKTVKKMMQIRNKIECHKREYPRKDIFFIRVVNKNLYQRFLEFGMTPAKSLSLYFPAVPSEFLSDFVRGYFDGDGCVYAGLPSRKQVLVTSFTSGGRAFLLELKRRLLQVGGLNGGSLIKRADHHFVLQYSTNDSRQLYRFMYPTNTVPCLQRKRDIFEKFILNGSVV